MELLHVLPAQKTTAHFTGWCTSNLAWRALKRACFTPWKPTTFSCAEKVSTLTSSQFGCAAQTLKLHAPWNFCTSCQHRKPQHTSLGGARATWQALKRACFTPWKPTTFSCAEKVSTLTSSQFGCAAQTLKLHAPWNFCTSCQHRKPQHTSLGGARATWQGSEEGLFYTLEADYF